MKTVIAALVLFGSSAFACPDLSGNFTCTSPDGTEEISLSQAVNQAGVTVYTMANAMGTYEVAADSIAKNFAAPTKTGTQMSTNVALTCDGDAAVMQKANFIETNAQNFLVSHGTSDMRISLDVDKNLSMIGSCSKDSVTTAVQQNCIRH